MSALGRMFLQTANFLSCKVHGFIRGELVRLYGEKQADIWTPRLAVYDLINHQVSTKPGAVYDWHHDCKWMLCDDEEKDWEQFFLCVPTFVISNGGDGVSSINFCQQEETKDKHGRNRREPAGRKMKLAAESLHYQLFGSNSLFYHKPKVESPPLNYTHWVITCRESRDNFSAA